MTKRILFLCSQNKLRSPTAEAVFADHPKVEVDSAGLNHDAEVPLSEEQVEWADLILVMQKEHRSRLNRKFGKALGGNEWWCSTSLMTTTTWTRSSSSC